MGFPRQEYWNRLPFHSPGDLPGLEPASPELTGGFFTTEPWGKPNLPLGNTKYIKKNTELFVCMYKITIMFHQWPSNWIYQTQRLSNLENLLSMLYKKLYTCLSFLVPLFLANYNSIFYDRSLFILAGSISKMHLHSTDAHLISAALCTECFNFHK